MRIQEAQLTNDELLRRSRSGDDDACEVLLRRFTPLFAAIILKEHRIPEADVDDVLQVIRLRFFRHIKLVKNPGSFLAKVANTACLEHHRRTRRQRTAYAHLALLRAPRSGGLRWRELAVISRLDIASILERVGARCAELLAAVRLGEMTQKEYAAANRIALGTIGPAVVRCLRKMRAVLMAAGYGGATGGSEF